MERGSLARIGSIIIGSISLPLENRTDGSGALGVNIGVYIFMGGWLEDVGFCIVFV